MEKERKGEIAYKILKLRMANESLPIRLNKNDFIEKINKGGQESGIPKEELKEFFTGLLQELMEETFKE